jgi:hypothetical protein
MPMIETAAISRDSITPVMHGLIGGMRIVVGDEAV